MLFTIIFSVIHVLSALVVIVTVLLHSGRGGGLSDMFGGGMGSVASGSTVVERNLSRITILSGLIFAFCSAVLVIRLQ
jgi:preprotein translocase subunit SecG